MANTPPILPVRFLGGSSYADVFGVNTTVQLGTGGTAIAGSATTSILLPRPACTSAQLLALKLVAMTAAVSASGTVLMTVYKVDNSGSPADRTLTAATSLEADFITAASRTYAVPITAAAIQNITFNAADIARIDVVSNNTIGTAPVVTLSALWAVIKP